MFPRGQIFALDGQICPGLQEKEKHTGLGIIPLASINASKMTQAHAVVFYFTCNGHHPGECGRTRCRGGGIHPDGGTVKNCGYFERMRTPRNFTRKKSHEKIKSD
jgi:hypothetical protein